MTQGDLFDRVLWSLNETLFDDSRWPATASLMEQLCGATGMELVVGQGSGADVRIHFARFYSGGQRRADLERQYFDGYHPWDERIPRLRKLPDSRVTHVRELYSEDELRTSPAYNEGLRRTGTQNGLNVRMDLTSGGRIVLALGDPVDSTGWGARQLEAVRRLLPHVRHLVQTRQALAYADAVNDSFERVIHHLRLPIVHLDRNARIAAVNEPARALLSRGDGLYEDDGRLRCHLAADDVRLRNLVTKALPKLGDAPVGGTMTVRRQPTLPRLAVHISPVSPRQLHFGPPSLGALVILVEPLRSEPDENLVASILGLTPAESRVAVSLAAGHSVRDIALLSGRTQDTIRSHIKRIYGKQGISRQADLVRLVLLSAAPTPAPPMATDGIPSSDSTRPFPDSGYSD